MKKTYPLLLAILTISHLLLTTYAIAQSVKKKQLLLIGTFHFNNPNADAVKTIDFDITTPIVQEELEQITDRIKGFAPHQIFVEWSYDKQSQLDSLYHLYQQGQYEAYINQKYKSQEKRMSYLRDEVSQLAFRAAHKTGLPQVKAIDYFLPMPYDTVMNAIKIAKQTEVMNEINSFISTMEKEANKKRKTMSLTNILLDLNTPISRQQNRSIYLTTLNRAGSIDNFAGAFSVAAWYQRNLYMYALMQKQMQAKDQKAVLILGAGHIAMIKKFIEDDGRYEVVELKDVLNKTSK